jgi:ubiquinone/menaquinone biosynthesis C-methylase UbiE
LSNYKADNAGNYEQSMGRWSARLAPRFLDFAGLAGSRHVLDVGCGTGSLTFALATALADASIVGMDYTETFVEHARSQARDPRVRFEQGDAAALAYGDGEFDATVSLLVLNFVPEAERAAREMKRVTRPGGVVAAAVWDFMGGLTFLRVMIDTAAALDPCGEVFRSRQFCAPFTRPGQLADTWQEIGLRNVEQTSLMIRMEFTSFTDYWSPWLGGQGTVGAFVTSLDDPKRDLVEQHVRKAYLAGSHDGPRSFTGTAWAVRGIV